MSTLQNRQIIYTLCNVLKKITAKPNEVSKQYLKNAAGSQTF